VNRRELLIRCADAAIAWPLAARAQQKAPPVIGFLGSGSPGPFAPLSA
jgi:putative tryptophan/tyrosine transport system substrate-binding protein